MQLKTNSSKRLTEQFVTHNKKKKTRWNWDGFVWNDQAAIDGNNGRIPFCVIACVKNVHVNSGAFCNENTSPSRTEAQSVGFLFPSYF